MFRLQLADPDRNSAELAIQLQALGLRIHTTLGDGNCLFRALSDQLYGSEAYHLALRAEITAWMTAHPDRYAAFVEGDGGFDQHLREMRIPSASCPRIVSFTPRIFIYLLVGTYGGHLELSAFAHLKRKNVKVIQPGLVYVIEWNTGSPVKETFTSESENESDTPLSPTHEREQRRARRDKIRESKPSERKPREQPKKSSAADTVYVAYVFDPEPRLLVASLTQNVVIMTGSTFLLCGPLPVNFLLLQTQTVMTTSLWRQRRQQRPQSQ